MSTDSTHTATRRHRYRWRAHPRHEALAIKLLAAIGLGGLLGIFWLALGTCTG